MLTIGVGVTLACVGVHAAHVGGGGWFAKSVSGTFLFVLGFLVTHLCIDIILRLLSLAMYLRLFGFSSKGLTSSHPDEADSSTE